MRVRAPVNYKAEPGGTNTPGWLKSQEKAVDAASKADGDKENASSQQKHSKKHSPSISGAAKADHSKFFLLQPEGYWTT